MRARRLMAISDASRMRRGASPGRRPILQASSPASPDETREGLPQRRLLYGRRKGPKLSAHQEALRATLLPQLAWRLERGADPRLGFTPAVGGVGVENRLR